MRFHDPKLRNMAHALSLSVFIAFKGTYLFVCLRLYIRVNNFSVILGSEVSK